MSDWQHTLAGWVVIGLVFLVFQLLTVPLSALVWRLRHRLSLERLKGTLNLIILLPAISAALVALSPTRALCAQRAMCYLGWLQQNLNVQSELLLRALVVLFVPVALWWLSHAVHRAVLALRTIRRLRAHSLPPSASLSKVLRKVLPPDWRSRFREVPMPCSADGVYAGICFLSCDTVQKLSEAQLQAVVAHETQHLRARDGWLTLVAGILAGGWSAVHRRWTNAAELLADRRAMHMGIKRTDLARTLLQRQVQAQGLALGFGAEGTLLEERLRYLLAQDADAERSHSVWTWWVAIAACAGGLVHTLWHIADATTCTVHCLFFH